MTVVEEFCNDITFIKDGRIKLSGNLDEEKAKRGKDKYLIHSESLDSLSNIQALPYVVNAEERKDEIFVELSDNKSSNEFLKDLLREDIQVDVFKPFRPSLEELFISMDKEA